jgi:hypothetical protein
MTNTSQFCMNNLQTLKSATNPTYTRIFWSTFKNSWIQWINNLECHTDRPICNVYKSINFPFSVPCHWTETINMVQKSVRTLASIHMWQPRLIMWGDSFTLQILDVIWVLIPNLSCNHTCKHLNSTTLPSSKLLAPISCNVESKSDRIPGGKLVLLLVKVD